MAAATGQNDAQQRIAAYLSSNQPGSNPINRTVFNMAKELLDEAGKRQRELHATKTRLQELDNENKHMKELLEEYQRDLRADLNKIMSSEKYDQGFDETQKRQLSEIVTDGKDATVTQLSDLFTKMVHKCWAYEGTIGKLQEQLLQAHTAADRRGSSTTIQGDSTVGANNKQENEKDDIIHAMDVLLATSTLTMQLLIGEHLDVWEKRCIQEKAETASKRAELLEPVKVGLFRYLRLQDVVQRRFLKPYATMESMEKYFKKNYLAKWSDDTVILVIRRVHRAELEGRTNIVEGENVVMEGQEEAETKEMSEVLDKWFINVTEEIPKATIEQMVEKATEQS